MVYDKTRIEYSVMLPRIFTYGSSEAGLLTKIDKKRIMVVISLRSFLSKIPE